MASKKSKKPKKRTRPRRQTSRRSRQLKLSYVLIPIVLVSLVGGALLMANPPSSPGVPPPVVDEEPPPVVDEEPAPVVDEEPAPVVDEEPAPASSEGPRLVFDETSFDFGAVPLDTLVEHDFVYRNVGNAPLVLQDKPEIETVEGC